MTASLLLAAALAGAAYTLTPGPAFLALLGIGAGQGRIAGAGFLCGHFVGDIVWALLALLAIIGTSGIRRLYRQNEIWIVRASGLMFVGFAVNAVMHAVPGLVARRA